MSKNKESKPTTSAVTRFPRERKIPEGEEWSSKRVFNEIHSCVTSQIHFTKSWQSVVVSLWAMGTYLHEQFPCYGHLWLNSPTTHSGKTKLLGVLSALCYKASDPQLQPTAAVLFRFPMEIGGTLLIDEVDNLDPARQSEVIGVLNHYHRHGSVYRNTPGRNRKYKLEKFPIYCPKVIAGIESLPVTLQDRCIRIALHRKKRAEKIERFLPEGREGLEPLRDQIEAWSIREALDVMRAYRDRDSLGVPDVIEDDRVRDILEPLFAVASVLPKHVRQTLSEGAHEIAKGRKAEEGESNPVVASIQVRTDNFPKREDVWKLRTDPACQILGEIPGIEDRAKAQEVLRKLGFTSHNCRFDKKVLRAYRIPRRQLEKLRERYS